MFCKHCGAQLDDDAKFCAYCGKSFVEAAQATQNDTNINKSKKSNSVIPKIALILACVSMWFPIALMLIYITENPLLILPLLAGLLALIPAIIFSIISLIKGFKDRKANPEKNEKLLPRFFSLALCTVLPVIVLIIASAISMPVDYSRATKTFNSGNYEDASRMFAELGDYKDSVAMADESNYLLAIEYAESKCWEEARDLLEPLAEKNYKSARDLYTYCHIRVQADIKILSAESSLKSILKDPSSYQALQKTWSYNVAEESSGSYRVDFYITIKYSATNSFGGRVSDVYEKNSYVFFKNSYGYSVKDIKDILGKSVSQITQE